MSSGARIEAVCRFNRFYRKSLPSFALDSPFSPAQARVLCELAHREQPAASELAATLELDPGYLSRILSGFLAKGLIRKSASPADGRRNLLRLTEKGRAAAESLDKASTRQIGLMLASLAEPAQSRLVQAMGTVEALLSDRPRSYSLRDHRPGDLGWIVQRHAEVYAHEYAWDAQFEAMVAEIAVNFIRRSNPAREHCWIAEIDGERAGSVMLVSKSATVAKLRLLLVEPAARGMGIGGKLVEECIRFSRAAGYRKLTLWTNSVLHAARRVYENAGFLLVREEPHRSFGKDLIAQTWDLKL